MLENSARAANCKSDPPVRKDAVLQEKQRIFMANSPSRHSAKRREWLK